MMMVNGWMDEWMDGWMDGWKFIFIKRRMKINFFFGEIEMNPNKIQFFPSWFCFVLFCFTWNGIESESHISFFFLFFPIVIYIFCCWFFSNEIKVATKKKQQQQQQNASKWFDFSFCFSSSISTLIRLICFFLFWPKQQQQ